MQKKTFLFIGGCADGARIGIEVDQFDRFFVELPTLTKDEYTRRVITIGLPRFSDAEPALEFYALASISTEQAAELLIKNYHP